MSQSTINSILFQWSGHTQLDSISTTELETLVQENEFSPSLQLLLAKKYQLTSSPLYPTQIQKAVCYFPSALHLHQWLALEDITEGTHQMDEHIDEKLNSLISEQLAQYQEADTTHPLEFEKETPKIVKDYFEAQGIEIDLSAVPQDKFTKQLRSFTAWLKVLKHHEENSQNLAEMGEEQEKMIAIIAEKANNATEVVTEAMAEIWLKQGNKQKAIDIYSKLSFIFPEKSVYFASQIEQLKQKKI
jgi:hypothetical protein